MNQPAGPTPIEFTQHQEARKNIRTQELRGFAKDDDAAAPREQLYPRDPSLVWRSRDCELEPELTLFDDFNGLDDDLRKKTDLYRWDQHRCDCAPYVPAVR